MKRQFSGAIYLFAAVCMVVFARCGSDMITSDKTDSLESAALIDSESIYQSPGKWDNQYGDTITLSSLTGKIPVMSMVFTRCTFACPRIVADMRAVEKQIPPDKQGKVLFVLVSFDADRDHTNELKKFAKKMKLNQNWLILHGNEEDVRELSMLLNVKYKKQPNGDFTHSSGFVLLDTRGAIAGQVDGLGADPKTIIERIKSM